MFNCTDSFILPAQICYCVPPVNFNFTYYTFQLKNSYFALLYNFCLFIDILHYDISFLCTPKTVCSLTIIKVIALKSCLVSLIQELPQRQSVFTALSPVYVSYFVVIVSACLRIFIGNQTFKIIC